MSIMSIKDRATVTVTLRRTTVEALRVVKGTKSWDPFMLTLARRKSQGTRAICMFCGDVLETESVYTSPIMLAAENDWTEISVKGKGKAIGFACPECLSKLGTAK